ncbi:MAG: AAA family ATPase [Pirellulales bacterium]|nr:AAA family ATPase [Pirellulales bacterium]
MMPEAKPPFLKRVHIENFKSIRHCDVELQPLTLLVGPNGSGKTNFLDALRFVRELLTRPPEEVIRVFGGTIEPFSFPAVFCQQPTQYEHACSVDEFLEETIGSVEPLVVNLNVTLPSGETAEYSLELELMLSVREERCEVTDRSGESIAHYHVRRGEIISNSLETPPPAFKDRPYLTSVAPFPPFDSVFQSLQSMRFYSIQPDSIAKEATTIHDFLASEGSGLASILGRIGQKRPIVKDRIDDYLRAVLPTLRESLLIPLPEISPMLDKTGKVREVRTNTNSWHVHFLFGDEDRGTIEFGPASMSDGTLHALGVLVALFQCRDLPAKSPIPLVAIEEPEANLHPGAAEVLMDAMTEATSFTQVMATTHSPDFLDYPDLNPESLLVFDASGGETVVAKADEASMSAIRDKLYTAGELLRLDQLKPGTTTTPK